MTRSGSGISAIFASTSLSPSALLLPAARFRLQLLGALLHRGSFLVRESLGLPGVRLRGLFLSHGQRLLERDESPGPQLLSPDGFKGAGHGVTAPSVSLPTMEVIVQRGFASCLCPRVRSRMAAPEIWFLRRAGCRQPLLPTAKVREAAAVRSRHQQEWPDRRLPKHRVRRQRLSGAGLSRAGLAAAGLKENVRPGVVLASPSPKDGGTLRGTSPCRGAPSPVPLAGCPHGPCAVLGGGAVLGAEFVPRPLPFKPADPVRRQRAVCSRNGARNSGR